MQINWKSWIGGMALLVTAVALVSSLYALITSNVPIEVRLPVLAIGGVIALLVVIAMVAGAFTLFNLADAQEALGLPEGSVRAIIALSLIVLFAILTIYLYTDLSRPQVQHSPQLTSDERDSFLHNIPSQKIIASISNGKDATNAEHFTIYYYDGSYAADELAKQILAVIGTLMTSVTSFYFATKSQSTSTGTGGTQTPKPSLRAVEPLEIVRGTEVELKISGENLNLVREAKIVLGANEVAAADVVSNANLVKCKITVPATSSVGAWTVVVSDITGQSAQLSNVLKLT